MNQALNFSSNPIRLENSPATVLQQSDQLMLHVCFQILMDAVEKDGLLEAMYWKDEDGNFSEDYLTLMTLMNWWKKRLVAERSQTLVLDAAQVAQDDAMLEKLIRIRSILSF